MEWVIENRNWLFDGAAVTVPLAIIGWFIYGHMVKQTQKGGKNSTNIQVGGSLNIGVKKDGE